jgi:hypothetical protein
MNGFTALIATTVAAFLLIIGIGKSECISECFGNAAPATLPRTATARFPPYLSKEEARQA